MPDCRRIGYVYPIYAQRQSMKRQPSACATRDQLFSLDVTTSDFKTQVEEGGFVIHLIAIEVDRLKTQVEAPGSRRLAVVERTLMALAVELQHPHNQTFDSVASLLFFILAHHGGFSLSEPSDFRCCTEIPGWA